MSSENLKIDTNLNIKNADYIAFVDASGDDGFKFNGKESSSICYSVCMFVIKKDDLDYNIEILNKIKKIVGCKPSNELKYSKIRRHRRSSDVHNLVSQFKGSVVSWVAFKQELTEDSSFSDVKNKTLGQICHIFPIKSLPIVLNSDMNSSVFIAVDVMKKIEMDGVSEILKEANDFGININGKQAIGSYNLKFKDSKSHDSILIQAADIFAGIVRNSFENLYLNRKKLPRCSPCLQLANTGKVKNLCNNKTFRLAHTYTGDIRYIHNLLHKDEDGKVLFYGVNCFPVAHTLNFRFMECRLK